MQRIIKNEYVCQEGESENLLRDSVPDGEKAISLPCLYNNNSTEIPSETSLTSLVFTDSKVLTPYYKRSAEPLFLNVTRLIEVSPSIGHIGFLTLTFKDNVTDHKEANRRFNSFNVHFLKPFADLGHWIRVIERQTRGAWHYHLLIQTSQDIQKGFDFAEYDSYMNQITKQTSKKERIRLSRLATSSANPHLRLFWSQLRMACSKYGFGRSEMLPIRSNSEALSRYIGKYISKNFGTREKSDCGVRYVAYSQGWLKNSIKFQWHTPGSQLYRKKLAHFCASHGCTETYQLADKLGPNWQYKHAPIIMGLPDDLTESDTLQAFDNALPHENNTIKRIEEKSYQKWKKQDERKQLTNSWHNPCPF